MSVNGRDKKVWRGRGGGVIMISEIGPKKREEFQGVRQNEN